MHKEYEVDAAAMCDALSGLPGVLTAALELDGSSGVLRVRLDAGADEAHVVGAAIAGLRRTRELGPGGSRLRLVGPSGQAVIAVVEPHAGPVARRPDLLVDEPRAQAPQPIGRPPSAPPPVVWQPLPQVAPRPAAQAPTAEPLGAEPLGAEPLGAEPLGAEALSPGPLSPDEVPDDDGARLVLDRVEVTHERLQMWATVHLVRGESRFSGSAGATATGAGPHRAVAAATARAAESALGDDVRLDGEAVDVLPVGQDQIGVVIVTLLTERGVDRLTGAALVRDDGRDTIVRATLDALNRRAETLRVERPASLA